MNNKNLSIFLASLLLSFGFAYNLYSKEETNTTGKIYVKSPNANLIITASILKAFNIDSLIQEDNKKTAKSLERLRIEKIKEFVVAMNTQCNKTRNIDSISNEENFNQFVSEFENIVEIDRIATKENTTIDSLRKIERTAKNNARMALLLNQDPDVQKKLNEDETVNIYNQSIENAAKIIKAVEKKHKETIGTKTCVHLALGYHDATLTKNTLHKITQYSVQSDLKGSLGESDRTHHLQKEADDFCKTYDELSDCMNKRLDPGDRNRFSEDIYDGITNLKEGDAPNNNWTKETEDTVFQPTKTN